MAAAAVVATIFALFGSALGKETTLAFRDTDRLYAPVRVLVDDALRSGRLPLWNPHLCLGQPLFAEGIHGVLHPISLAGAQAVPGDVDFLLVAHLLAAALGSFALARSMGASPTASAGSGLAYALSGYVLSMTGNLVFLAGAGSGPWIAAAARSAGGGSPLGPLATALATAIAFLSGDAQAALVSVALGLALAWAAGGPRGAGRALLGALTGVALAAVQILATRAILPETTRALPLATGEALQWPLRPARILEWMIPGLVRGELALARIPEVLDGAVIPGQFAESIYVGAPVLLLALVGFRAAGADPARRRTGIVLAVGLALLVWLALGHLLGARQLLQHVPIWSRFRYPEKLMGPIVLCLAVFAGLGIDAAAGGRLGRMAVRAAIGGATLSALAYAFVDLAPGTIRGLFGALEDPAAWFLIENLRSGLLHPVLALAALLAVDRFAHRARHTLLAAVAVGTLAAAADHGAHLGVASAHEATSPFHFAAEAPGPRLAHPYEKDLAPTAEYDAVDVHAFLLRTAMVPAANVGRRVDHTDCYGAFLSSRRDALVSATGDRTIGALRRYGLSHVVLPPPDDPASLAAAAASTAGGRLAESIDDPPISVWAVPHRPWALFAERARAVPTPAEALPLLVDLIRRGEHSTVVVESPSPPTTSPGKVLSIERTPERLRVEAEAEGDALLVLNDSYWSGWRAYVDGRETEILAADLIVRAVRWPPGRHSLEMRYEPPGLRSGLIVSGAGAVLALVLGAHGLLELRRRRPVPPELP